MYEVYTNNTIIYDAASLDGEELAAGQPGGEKGGGES